jgi:HAE1 family hydrophobic/amphiphilic exporter-1
VIDDAIVVLENIFRFVHEKGMKPFPAAIAATKDIGLAVLATTLSLVAVFLPIGFMSGIVGRFMSSFGFTMAFAIGVSLFVSFTVTPMLAARWLDPPGAQKRPSVLERVVDRLYHPVERGYMAMLGWSMRHRWVILLGCVAALGSCGPLFKAVPKGFIPENDEAQFEINVRAPEGTSLPATLLIADRVARETRRIPGVAYTLATIGDNEQRTPNLARIYVKLVDPKDRTASHRELMARARRDVLSRLPKDLRIDVSDVAMFNTGTSTKLVQYVVSGPSVGELARVADHVMAKLRKVPGATDVDSSLVLGKPEVQLEVLRDKAADLGVQVADISNAARLMVGGLKASTYEENGEDYDIRLRAGEADRSRLDRLGSIMVPSTKVGSVALRDVVHFREEAGPSEVNRLNRRRQVTISANVLPGFGESDVLSAVERIVRDEHLPAGYGAQAIGRSKETARAAAAFGFAFLLSFIFMYLVLAAQFESWIHPFTILVSLPLTVPFALLSLLIFHQSLTIMSALGLLVLFGIVKKNSILQVDHANNLRAEGMPRDQAILAANRDRLRPILMTTVAFVAGMLPLMTSRGIGAGINRATAGIVIGGQSLSLLLTLLATPVVYSLLDDLAAWLRRRFTRGSGVDRGRGEVATSLDVEDVPPLRAVGER